MGEFVYTGPDDGRNDDASLKIENEAEAWAHQVAWEAELTGRAPMGREPEPKRWRRTLGWIGRALVAYDPNGNPIF